MPSGFDDFPELHDDVKDHVTSLSRQWKPPIALVAPVPWLAAALGDLAEHTPQRDPNTRWESLLAIDALHVVPNPFAHLAKTGRVYFVSITEAPGRAAFSATEFLWESGFSVIEVARPIIPAKGGLAELAVGIARRTPTRFVGDEEESARSAPDHEQ